MKLEAGIRDFDRKAAMVLEAGKQKRTIDALQLEANERKIVELQLEASRSKKLLRQAKASSSPCEHCSKVGHTSARCWNLADNAAAKSSYLAQIKKVVKPESATPQLTFVDVIDQVAAVSDPLTGQNASATLYAGGILVPGHMLYNTRYEKRYAITKVGSAQYVGAVSLTFQFHDNTTLTVDIVSLLLKMKVLAYDVVYIPFPDNQRRVPSGPKWAFSDVEKGGAVKRVGAHVKNGKIIYRTSIGRVDTVNAAKDFGINHVVYYTASSEVGDCGGPVFNEHGKVVAIHREGHENGATNGGTYTQGMGSRLTLSQDFCAALPTMIPMSC